MSTSFSVIVPAGAPVPDIGTVCRESGDAFRRFWSRHGIDLPEGSPGAEVAPVGPPETTSWQPVTDGAQGIDLSMAVLRFGWRPFGFVEQQCFTDQTWHREMPGWLNEKPGPLTEYRYGKAHSGAAPGILRGMIAGTVASLTGGAVTSFDGAYGRGIKAFTGVEFLSVFRVPAEEPSDLRAESWREIEEGKRALIAVLENNETGRE